MTETKRFIDFDDTATYIPVNDIYTYMPDLGIPETRLKITAPLSSFTFDQIKDLFSKDRKISLYESKDQTVTLEGVEQTVNMVNLCIEYNHFCKNITCNYSEENDLWTIEVTKKDETELLIESNKEDALVAYDAVAQLYETKTSTTA